VTELTREKNVYLADFERFEREQSQQGGTPALQRLHKAAIARFAEMGFPGPRDEEWRFTNLAPLLKVHFELAQEGEGARDDYGLRAEDGTVSQVLCVNGSRPFVQDRGATLPRGVIVSGLAEALQAQPALVEAHLARHADYKGHTFTALNTAFLRDGAFVYVPPGTVVEHPIHVHFLVTAAGRPHVWHRRCLIVMGANSQATFVESYEGPPQDVYFTNAVTEVVLGEDAVVDHYKLQKEGGDAFHVATMQVAQGRSSNFSSHSVALGGAFVRNQVNAVLGAEGCECTLNGLYQATGTQLVDNHTVIDHAQPHCASHELYKGILDGKARGVFNGKIFVRQDAQKTDAKQTNQTLLLSDDATINTKPQLEIYANDVKCTHGATVGQLAAEALFYLRSRGIGRDQARALLTYAFANDVVRRIKVESIRNHLEQTLLAGHNLPRDENTEERS
jgi:Fe-S cluster assembly protein SufD